YYEYHFLLLVPPLGILAARGLDGAASQTTWLRAPPWATLVAVMVIAVLACSMPTLKRVASSRHAISEPSPLTAYQDRRSPVYRSLRSELVFLDDPFACSGPHVS